MAAYFHKRKGYENVESVQLEFRYESFRESGEEIEAAADALHKTIKGVTGFQTAENLGEKGSGPTVKASKSRQPKVSIDKEAKQSLQELERKQLPIPDLVIDPEFQSLLEPLSEGEFDQLEQNILNDGGIRDAFVVWAHEGKHILLDGHHRNIIRKNHDLPMPDPVIMEFRDREEALVWIIQNQRGRRSINSYVQMELVAKLRPKIASQASLRQRAAQRNVAAEKAKQKAIELNAPINTRNTLAELAKVSENTMQKGLDLIEKAPEELKQKLRKGEISINQAHKLVKKPKDKEPSGRRLKSGTSQQESSLAAANSSEMVSPVPNIEPCDLIVINPPWEQGDHGAYRPMPVQEIAGLPLDRMATENSLLWLWTPNVHLRDAHVLLDRWGFTYRALFTWIFESSESGQWLKNGSAQCLLASKGSPLSENIQPMRSWIQAEREAEARTPLDFYLRITSAYPVSRRLDVFSDKPREGWIQWPSRKS